MALKLKKLICAAAAVLCVGAFGANATLPDNAIGLRLSAGSLLGGELNYQKGLGKSNRLELGVSGRFKSEVGFSWTYLGAVGIYQWHWDIPGVKGLNWYAGPGAGVGLVSYTIDILGTKTSDSWAYLNVGGQVGIEYDLNVSKVPLLLSLDIRPMFGLLNSEGFGWDLGLGVRYTF